MTRSMRAFVTKGRTDIDRQSWLNRTHIGPVYRNGKAGPKMVEMTGSVLVTNIFGTKKPTLRTRFLIL